MALKYSLLLQKQDETQIDLMKDLISPPFNFYKTDGILIWRYAMSSGRIWK